MTEFNEHVWTERAALNELRRERDALRTHATALTDSLADATREIEALRGRIRLLEQSQPETLR